MEVEILFLTRAVLKWWMWKLRYGKVVVIVRRRAVERLLVVRKWKTVFSGHVECWIIENTPAIDPRRYVASRVIAMWINVSLHSFPLRNAGASWNSGRRSGVTVWRRMRRVVVVVRRWSFGGMVV
ncbi:hypothetical protein Hanom_Chr08g00725931 [Helianthus anomalus]